MDPATRLVRRPHCESCRIVYNLWITHQSTSAGLGFGTVEGTQRYANAMDTHLSGQRQLDRELFRAFRVEEDFLRIRADPPLGLINLMRRTRNRLPIPTRPIDLGIT